MTEVERQMVFKLLEGPIPGRDILLRQIPRCLVKLWPDGSGSFEIECESTERADTEDHYVAVAWDKDTDGTPIEILLHVVQGKLKDLEIVTFSEKIVKKKLNPADWKLACK